MRRLLALTLALLLLVPNLAVAQGGCSVYRTWATGDSLTAGDLNSSFTAVGQTNMEFSCLDDYSASAAEMNTTTDPNSAGSGSLATTGQGELERLRHVLKHAFTRSQWWTHYEDADFAERAIRNHYGVITSGTPKTPFRIQASGSGDARLHVAVIGFTNQGVHHETALLRVHADNVTRLLVPLGGDVHVGSSLRLGTRGAASHAALFQGEHSNTGLFFPAPDVLGWTLAGTEQMRLHATALVPTVGTVAGGGNSSSTLTLRGASAGGNGDYVSINAGATEVYRFHRSALSFVGTNTDIGDLTGSRPRSVHATTGFSAGEGTVSLPSYTFGAQTTTGLYYPAASHFGVTVGGTQMGRFHAASNGDTQGILSIAAIHFQHVASGRFTAIKAHATSSATTIYQLPETDGAAGQILSTRGGGILEWTNSSAGVALGDTQTWTGQNTFSYVGPAIRLSGSEAQIFIGSTTDPGWGATAFVLQLAAGNGGAIYTQGNGRLRFTQNVYFDGTNEKYISTDAATQMNFNAGVTTIQWAASGTAGNVITFTDEVVINASGTIHGAPTGGAKGTGTINATAVYDDNTLLSDWAFDLYYDGRVRAGDPFYRGQRLYPFAETLRVSRDERRLPWMPTRETFEAERSLGGMISRLWFGQEQQQMYLFDQARRIEALTHEIEALKRAPGGRR